MTPLAAALEKIAGREAEFIEACGKMPRHPGFRRDHARERVTYRLKLSWQHMELLEQHYRDETRAWPNKPAPKIAAPAPALPPGDRE